jgi:hypothetical protein
MAAFALPLSAVTDASAVELEVVDVVAAADTSDEVSWGLSFSEDLSSILCAPSCCSTRAFFAGGSVLSDTDDVSLAFRKKNFFCFVFFCRCYFCCEHTLFNYRKKKPKTNKNLCQPTLQCRG